MVVSRGDEALLRFEGRHGWHFPRALDGRYAGYHPADSTAAISHLEELRRLGAEYFVLPSTAFWWLEHYEDLRRHLDRYQVLVRDDDCLVFHLVESGGGSADASIGVSDEDLRHPLREKAMIGELVKNLLPNGVPTAILSLPGGPEVAPAGCRSWQLSQDMAQNRSKFSEALAELARTGIRFFVVPRMAFEWLKRNPAHAESLQNGHRLVTRQQYACEIYQLSEKSPPVRPSRSEAQGSDGGGPAEMRGLLQRLRVALGLGGDAG